MEAPSAHASGTQGRPNVLLLIADQFVAHALSCAGAEHLSTPNLDGLAACGVRFERAYTTFPLCVPSRASMLTGRMPHELGLDGNRDTDLVRGRKEPGQDLHSLGHLLSPAGYDCVFAGKYHATRASAGPDDGFTVLRPFGDVGLAEACADWLRDRGDTGRPFLLIASFDDPHSICEYARGQALPYGDIAPVGPRDAPPLPMNFARAVDEAEAPRHEKHLQNTVYATETYTPDQWRDYRHAYACLIERADRMIGVVLDALDSAALGENTLTLFTSDHGDGDASHGWNQKTALFEECIRVPLIMAGPGVERGVSDRLVSVGLDLLPTLCGVANVPTPPESTGRDMRTATDECDEMTRTVVVETAFDRGARPVTRGRAMIAGQYKYSIYNWGRWREQLHDLMDDPGELRNLAAESRYDIILEEMRGRLLAWCLDNDDRSFLKALRLPSDTDPAVHARIFERPY